LAAQGLRYLGDRALAATRASMRAPISSTLLPGVANVDGATVVEALRAAISDQLVVTDGRTFRFQHALTREAVLAELLPPERAAMSARALVAVRRAHPELAGPWCELAAELAEATGDQGDTAALLAESSRLWGSRTRLFGLTCGVRRHARTR
jgi:hypothetical protein